MFRSLIRSLTLAVLLTCGVAGAAFGAPARAQARTVWLCRPGMSPDPCAPGLSTTVYSPTLKPLRVTHPRREKPHYDCFYVYPTVSDQKTTLSNLQVDPEQRSIALYQAARWSQHCRVFAPMYHQVTVTALDSGTRETPTQLREPVRDVTAAFRLYLRRDNHGRPFVLIGHSQGSFVLEQMIHATIDRDAALRARMLSAVLLGGNVLVRDNGRPGGTFRRVPACRNVHDISCVIAYSTFDGPVPADSLFGRTTVPGEHVLCVDPARLAGQRPQVVDPIFPSAPFAPGTLIAAGISLLHLDQPHPATVWTSEPGAYTARCASSGGADVLQITARGGAQTPTPSPNATWGLHLVDANIELGNLLSVAGDEYSEWTGLRDGHVARGG